MRYVLAKQILQSSTATYLDMVRYDLLKVQKKHNMRNIYVTFYLRQIENTVDIRSENM